MSRFYQNPFLLLAVLFCGTAPSSLSAQIDATSVITQTPGQAAFIKTRLGGLDAVTGKISFSLPVGPRLPGRIPAGFILTFDPFYGSGTLRPLVWRLGNAAQTDPTIAFSNTVTLFGNETVFTKPSWNVPLPSDATLQTWMQDRQVDFGRQEADKAVANLVAQYGSQLDGTPVESYVRDAIQTTSDGTKFLIWGHWHITYTLLGTHNDPDPPPGVLDLDKRGIIIDGDMAIFQVGMVTTFTTRWGDKVTITEAGTDAATGSTTALTTFTIQDQVTTGNQIVMTVTGTSGVWPPNAGDKPCWGLAIHVTNTLGGTTLPTADVAAYYQPLSRGPRFTGSTTWLGALVPSSCTETASDGTSRQTNFNFFTIPYTIQYPDQFLEKFIFEPPSTWDWLDNSWDYSTGAWAGSNNYGAPSQGQGDYFCGVDRILPDGTGQSVRTQKVVPIGRTIPYTYSWSWTTTGHTTSIYQFPQPTFGQDLPTLQSSLPYRLVKLTHVAMPTTDPTSRQAFLACTSAVVQEEHRHTEPTNLGSEVLDQLIQYSAWDLRSWVNPQGIPSIPTTAVAARTTTYTTNLPTQTVFASGRDSYGPTQTQSQTSAPATYSLLDGTEAAQWNDTNPPSPLPGPNLRTATITRALHPIAAQLQTLTEHRTLDGTDFGTTTTTYSPSTGLRTGTTAVRGGGAYTSTDTPVSYQSGQPLPTGVNKTLSGPDIAAGSTGGTDCTYGPAPAFAVTGTMDHIDGRWAISIPDLLGRPTQKTDVLGLVTTFDYDAWGRPWHETRNVGTGLVTTVTHTYDVTGTWKEDLVTTSDGANQTTHSSLDGFGHIVSVITKDSQGNIQTTQTFQFDGFGQKVGQSPVLTTTQQSWGMDTWTYDGQGREITHTDAQGRLLSQVTQEPTWDPIATAVVTRVMGAAVNIAPNVDQSFTRTEVHDLLGHLVAVYDQANQPSLYTYDGDGNLIQASQAGLVRTYEYNPMGFLVYRSEPEEGTTTFTNFTIQGTPLNTTRTGVSNQTPVITVNTVVTPNANLQPANIATSDGSQTLTRTLTYDPTTHLLSGIQDAEPYGTLSEIYSYDALFRCSGKTVTDVSRNRSFSVSQTMNALGSMVSLTYPGGGGRSPQTETLIVDGQNRPWEVLLDVTQFRGQMYYDLVNGTMVTNQLRLGNGASTIWQWDKGVLVDVTHSWGETGNTGQQTNAMTWTAGGLLRSRNQDSFYYDGLLRLTQSIVQGLNSGESINQTFAYDRFGNRTSNQFTYNAGNGGTQPYEVMPWTATYDPAHPNRLPASITGSNGSLATGAAYDDLGRMTEILAVPNNFNLYGTYWTYDARSRIISEEVNGGTTTFLLDGAGLRFKRTGPDGVITYTIYGFHQEPLIYFQDTPQVVTQAQFQTQKLGTSKLNSKMAPLVGQPVDYAGASILSPPTGTTVHVGDTVAFTGGTNDGTNFTWNFGDSTTATTQSANKAYAITGTFTVTFTASATGYKTSTASITITVIPALPVISTFVVTATTIAQGSSATMSWSTSGATSLSLDNGIGNVTGSTSRVVSPTSTTTYTLSATNTGGTVTRQVTLSVVQPPVIRGFSASPASIYQGAGSTLNWTVTGATSLSLDNGLGSVTGTSSRAISPSATTTYMLTATNTLNGVNVTRTAQTTVTVSPSPTVPTIQSFTADATTLAFGTGTILRWTVTNSIGTVAVTLNGSPVVQSGSSWSSPKYADHLKGWGHP